MWWQGNESYNCDKRRDYSAKGIVLSGLLLRPQLEYFDIDSITRDYSKIQAVYAALSNLDF